MVLGLNDDEPIRADFNFIYDTMTNLFTARLGEDGYDPYHLKRFLQVNIWKQNQRQNRIWNWIRDQPSLRFPVEPSQLDAHYRADIEDWMHEMAASGEDTSTQGVFIPLSLCEQVEQAAIHRHSQLYGTQQAGGLRQQYGSFQAEHGYKGPAYTDSEQRAAGIPIEYSERTNMHTGEVVRVPLLVHKPETNSRRERRFVHQQSVFNAHGNTDVMSDQWRGQRYEGSTQIPEAVDPNLVDLNDYPDYPETGPNVFTRYGKTLPNPVGKGKGKGSKGKGKDSRGRGKPRQVYRVD